VKVTLSGDVLLSSRCSLEAEELTRFARMVKAKCALLLDDGAGLTTQKGQKEAQQERRHEGSMVALAHGDLRAAGLPYRSPSL
jgi:hypothetical protein